jgi:ribonuclease HI
MKNRFVVCYVDGASRGNPGPSGIGVSIQDDKNNVIKEIKEYIGLKTNNVAEYIAVIRALKELKKMKISNGIINLDSELVVNQINGIYRTKDNVLRDLLLQIKEIEKEFSSIKYNYIPRNKNKIADKLANIAINLQGY